MEPIKEVINLIKDKPQVIELLYPESDDPNVHDMCEVLCKVFDMSIAELFPLRLYNKVFRDNFIKHLDLFKHKLIDVPSCKRCQVDAQLGLMVLEKLTKSHYVETSDMLTTLLVNAANVETAFFTHPSFAHVIDCITPDELKILAYLKGKSGFSYLSLYAANGPYEAFETLIEHSTLLKYELELKNPDSHDIYLANLIALGLLMKVDKCQSKENFDFALLETYCNLKEREDEMINHYRYMQVERGYYLLTLYGKYFVQACFL